MPRLIAASVEALDLEVAHHVRDGVALAADAGSRAGTRAVVEDQLRRRRGAHAELVLDLLAEREARAALLDDEQRQAARALVAGARVDEEHVAQLVSLTAPFVIHILAPFST